MASLIDLDAGALADGYRARRFDPVDVVGALDARIAEWEPHIHALYAYDPAAARADAKASAARWSAGAPLSALDGVPVSLKELIATRGVPTPVGTAATVLKPEDHDAPPAARMREAGAIIFAKTTVPDYGMLSSGLSSFHPLARNPWNLATNPGGSSAGAAAAAAAGYGPLHVGTDIGGSVRLPAAWCGLVGFKPTLGRIPIDPYYTGRCAGPMTRTVDDAARMMAVLSKPDPRDATSLPPEDIDWMSAIDGVHGLRVGVMMDAGCGMTLDGEIDAAVRAAAESFASAGATLVSIGPVLDRPILDGIDQYWRARAWAEIGALPEERQARVLPYILRWAETGAGVTGADAVSGFGGTFELRRRCAAAFADVDLILSPTTPNLAFPAEYASPLDDPALPFEHIAFTLPWNMGEQPAVSIHCGFSSAGTPIGLQIVTPRFADRQAIELARWYEARRGPITTWPTPPAGAV
ncbi:amidase [Acetobacteraceae bacterium KSS8]|uniref:Amidase n=1 Tax=Endosaccharibacter trunci TaxID=2812733 RepID=A0ABT1WAU7_9PROT|nr:amidase [Acetobacteraceae bacterium KSS8]